MEASAKSETRTAASTLAKEEMAGKTKELTVELHMAAFAVAISTRFRFYNVAHLASFAAKCLHDCTCFYKTIYLSQLYLRLKLQYIIL